MAAPDSETTKNIVSQALTMGGFFMLLLGVVCLTKPDLFIGMPGVGPSEITIGGWLLMVFGILDLTIARIFLNKKAK